MLIKEQSFRLIACKFMNLVNLPNSSLDVESGAEAGVWRRDMILCVGGVDSDAGHGE